MHNAPTPVEEHPLQARLLILLAAAGFTSMASMRLCDAMLPALSQTFSSDPGATAQVISGFALAYGVMQLVYGPLGDRFGRTRIVALALLLCAAAAATAAASSSLPALVAARVAMGMGAAGVIPTALAWIGDTFPLTQRQEVLARYTGATVLGMMTGAWCGGLFAQTLGWRWAFVAVALLFGAVSLTLWRTIQTQARTQAEAASRGLSSGADGLATTSASPPNNPPDANRPPYAQQVKDVLSQPWSRLVLAVVAIEGACVFGVTAFVPSVLHASFDVPLAQAGAVLAAFGVGGLVFSRTAARMLRRWGPPRVAAGGVVTLTVGLGTLAVMPHWAFSVPGCGIAGLGFYALHNALQLNATQLSSRARGTGISLFACALFFGQSAGVALAAWAFTQFPPGLCFAVTAGVMLVVGLGFAWRMAVRDRAAAAAAVASA